MDADVRMPASSLSTADGKIKLYIIRGQNMGD